MAPARYQKNAPTATLMTPRMSTSTGFSSGRRRAGLCVANIPAAMTHNSAPTKFITLNTLSSTTTTLRASISIPQQVRPADWRVERRHRLPHLLAHVLAPVGDPRADMHDELRAHEGGGVDLAFSLALGDEVVGVLGPDPGGVEVGGLPLVLAGHVVEQL